jgi:hypothetical protein
MDIDLSIKQLRANAKRKGTADKCKPEIKHPQINADYADFLRGF